MARIRTIKPEFWDSPGTACASYQTRLFFIAMWNWADDWGIGLASPKQLIAFAFPNDDDVTAKDFPTLAKEVANCFDVTFYEVAGRQYYAIPSWDLHQRTERKAKRTNPGPELAETRLFTGNEVVAKDFPTLTKEVPAWEREREREREREEGKGKELHVQAHDTFFETFWTVWPKRVGKGDAERAWKKAVKKVAPELIVAAATDYARSPYLPERQFIPLPSTWLNGERWADDLPQPSVTVTKAQKNMSTVDYFEAVERLAVEA
jgi:hypothetical protein